LLTRLSTIEGNNDKMMKYPTDTSPKVYGQERFVEHEISSSDEFRLFFKGIPLLQTVEDGTRRDAMSLFSCMVSVAHHFTYLEFIGITIASVSMTLFFCFYYYEPKPGDSHLLAARLHFNLVATAVLFPSTMLVAENFRRRELALRRYGTVKGQLCQLLVAFLTWRAPHLVMSEEWEKKAFETVKEAVEIANQILLLPTIRDRHKYVSQAKAFSSKVAKVRAGLVEKMLISQHHFHELVEDLKEAGMSPMEIMRLYQFTNIFAREFEALYNKKMYRSSSSVRSFIRVVLTFAIMFYGPYYSFVAGGLVATSNPGQTNIAFACCLTVMSTYLLLGIVAMHRATEDPFLWKFPGNALDVKFETDDILQKMNSIYACYKFRSTINEASL